MTNIVCDATTSAVAASAIVPAVQPTDSLETSITTLIVALVSFGLNWLFDKIRKRK